MDNLFFPLNVGKIAWDSAISQGWNVTVEKTASGKRRTITHQRLPNWTFSVSFPKLNYNEVKTLQDFYAQTRGSWLPFFYKDYEYHTARDVVLARVEPGKYQCLIPRGFVEPVEYVDNVTVYVDGSVASEDDYTIENGVIVFYDREISQTALVTADYDYYHKVVFSGDLQITQIFSNAYKVGLKLQVVR